MTLHELGALARGIAPLFHELKARISAVEGKERGLDGKDGPIGREGPEGKQGRDGRDGLPGRDGVDGKAGANGADGLGFDDFEEVSDGDRITIKRYICGDRIKEYVHKSVAMIYRGVWEQKSYDRGDVVTIGGSMWHCDKDTTDKPDEGSKSWTLSCKRGREGKPGKPGAKGLDGKDGRAGRDLTQTDGVNRW